MYRIIIFLLSILVWGCASPPEGRYVEAPTQTEAWNVSTQVLSKFFNVTMNDPNSRYISTDYRVTEEFGEQIRRRAEIRILEWGDKWLIYPKTYQSKNLAKTAYGDANPFKQEWGPEIPDGSLEEKILKDLDSRLYGDR